MEDGRRRTATHEDVREVPEHAAHAEIRQQRRGALGLPQRELRHLGRGAVYVRGAVDFRSAVQVRASVVIDVRISSVVRVRARVLEEHVPDEELRVRAGGCAEPGQYPVCVCVQPDESRSHVRRRIGKRKHTRTSYNPRRSNRAGSCAGGTQRAPQHRGARSRPQRSRACATTCAPRRREARIAGPTPARIRTSSDVNKRRPSNC